MVNIFEQRSRVKMSEYQAPELIVAGVYDWFFNAEDLVEVDWIRNILIRLGENETKVDKYIETFVYKQMKICCCTKMQQMANFLDEHARCLEPYISDSENSEEHNVDTVVKDADCRDDCHDDSGPLSSITTTNVEIDTTPIDTTEKCCDKIDATSDKIDASSDKIDASSDKIDSSCDTNETSCDKIDETEDEFGNESDDEASNESETRLDEDEVPLLGNDSDTTSDEPNSDCCNFYD